MSISTKTYQYYLTQVKAKREYCSELYVDIQNSKDMMFSRHDLVNEKFTFVNRRMEFNFK